MEKLKPGQESISSEIAPLLTNPTKLIVSKGIDLFVRKVEKKILVPLQPTYEDGFRERFLEIIGDPDVLPIAVINHQSHSDCITAARLSKDLTLLANEQRSEENQFKGFTLSVAASMQSGHQNSVVQQYFETTSDLTSKYYLNLQTYVRSKDEQEYGLNRGKNILFSRVLFKMVAKQENRVADGLILFPEGTMQGGRKMKEGNNGQINGMQNFDWESVDSIINGVEKRKRKVLIIPVGSHGGFNISDPSRDCRRMHLI